MLGVSETSCGMWTMAVSAVSDGMQIARAIFTKRENCIGIHLMYKRGSGTKRRCRDKAKGIKVIQSTKLRKCECNTKKKWKKIKHLVCYFLSHICSIVQQG